MRSILTLSLFLFSCATTPVAHQPVAAQAAICTHVGEVACSEDGALILRCEYRESEVAHWVPHMMCAPSTCMWSSPRSAECIR